MATVTEEALLVEKKSGVLRVTLNRPKVLNALTHQMLLDLHRHLVEAGMDREVRCVVLGASGRAFCAGADLENLKKHHETGKFSLGEDLRKYFNPIALQIQKLEKPVIGAVQGVAAGAGASLALACDLKICSDQASFVSAFIKVGLAPDTGMTHHLARFLGPALALEHAWTAKPIEAARALQFGLVNRVVPMERLESEVEALTEELSRMPRQALGLTKRTMLRAFENSFEEQLNYETQVQEILGSAQDHREGVAAFLEKRRPKFG
ncbi:MAG: enoyl-CoA hydratase/isomerase family protein [Elusimicrobia bacterium]|nr:enoyl-CoA hydratase/isomerase family protein [Elusimicrobiota bacterium]